MNAAKYNGGARALHWAIAVLIILNLATGLLHDPLENVVALMPLHKSVGLTILVLSLVRLGWRLAWTAPAYPASMTPLEVTVAKAVHGLLYVLMLAMPLTGWILSSSGTYPLDWFGMFPVAKLPVSKGSALAGFGHEFHEIGGWVLLLLVIGHVAAALRHHFVLKDNVLRRMI